MRTSRWLLVWALLALPSGCTGVGSSDSSVPRFAAAPCPSDVEIQLLVAHSCGYLTVLEDRSGGRERALSLFVVTITPPDAPFRPDPVLILGDDIGAMPDYGAHQSDAERLHRVVYVMDQRGVGHSRPELSCPEVDRVSTDGLVEPIGSPSIRQRAIAAVAACRTRLASSGIDPRDFDLSAMVADVEELRTVLGIESWNLAAYGSLSRLALEIIREHPGHVRAAYLDSPQFPQLDEPTEAALGTRYMLEELFRACDLDAACRSTYPDLRQAWADAIAGLAADPVEAHTELGDLLLDPGSFVRAVQASLSEDNAELSTFPAQVVDAGNRRVHVETTTALATHGSLCAGYRVRCSGSFSTGAYLSVLCRDEAPFVDPSAIDGAASGTPGLAEAFGTNPDLSVCPAWDVPAAPASVHAPVRSDVPVLMVMGQFDPFSPPRLAAEFSGSLEHAFRIDVPALSHTPLLQGGCQVEIRDRWLDQPASPPVGTACMDALRLEFGPRP